MSKKQTAHDDDMPAEIDFSKGLRGKFYHASAELNLPVYLDDQVQTGSRRWLTPRGSIYRRWSMTCLKRISN